MPTVDHGGSSTDFHPILAGIEVGIVVRSRTALRICAEMLAMNSHERTDRSTGRSDTGRFRNFDREGADGSLLSPLSEHHRSAFRAQGHVHDDRTIAPLGHRSLFPADQNPVFPSLLSTEALTEQHDLGPHGPMDRVDLHGRNQLQRNGVADRVLHGRATGPVRQGV